MAAEIEALRFDQEIATDASQYMAKLRKWPSDSFNGEDVIEQIQGVLDKVEANRAYREKNSNIWATLYRMTGGAYLIHSQLEMGDKLRLALPRLRKSLELWPDQARLPENVGYLETFLKNSGGNIQEYLTTVLQILRGPGDPQIPKLVEQISAVAQQANKS